VSDRLALLFDLDGTLIDSMPHHDTAWQRWHARHGLPFDEALFFERTAGRANAEIIGELLPALTRTQVDALGDEKEAIYRSIAADSLALIAGAAEFLVEARAAGHALAVCTASTPENMALAFARFGIDGWVDTVVSPADGLRGKPHPDIFLEAARRLGVTPARCLVFEDAPLGVEAAQRGGMPAVALTTTLPGAAFAAYPNLLCSAADFTALRLSDLALGRM
jgi:HAD superfamily hydrolase (TIGR01509 family)